ncbi:MAG: hypothetical protein FH753_01490 [Firmicutes bacterium]|nr:hypothetical protein [Bacillota bacterium]
MNKKSKGLVYGAIVTSLTLICLYLTNIIPTNKLFLLALSSSFLSIIVIEYGIKYALLTYISTSILGSFFIQNKIIIVFYIIFFGYYGIIKYYIERIRNIYIEWILKFSFFNVILLITYFLVSKYLINIDILSYKLIKLIILQLIFLIYDYFYSIMISQYLKRIKKNV